MSATTIQTPDAHRLPATTITDLMRLRPGRLMGRICRRPCRSASRRRFSGRVRRPTSPDCAAPRLLLGRSRATTGAPARRFRSTGGLFELNDESRVSWSSIALLVDDAHQRLIRAAVETASGARVSPLSEAERFDLVIGITGHAAYHAGQIQLIKKLI